MPDIFDELISRNKTPSGDIFDEVKLSFNQKQSQKPSFLQESGRHLARSVARAGESLLGLPGDILRSSQLGARQLEKGAGVFREKIGLQPRKTEEKRPGFPGSEELKKFSQDLFGKVVIPQSKSEEFIDDIVSDAALFALPTKGRIPFKRAIGTALAGNIAGKGAEKLEVGKGGQVATKLGTFFLASLAGKGNVKKFWKEQYKLADESIPEGARLNANKLDRRLDNLKKELRKGGIETPSQSFVEKPLNQLQKTIKDGELRVEDAVKAKQKLNELRSGLFDEVKGKKNQRFARTKINEISNAIDETLEKYGKENPAFWDHFKAANEAYSGFFQSKRVGNWIREAIPFKQLGKTSLLLAEAIFKPATLPISLGGYGAFKGGELVARLTKNPTLRRYYGNLMKSAAEENKSNFIKNLRVLEKEIKETDPDIFDVLASEKDFE